MCQGTSGSLTLEQYKLATKGAVCGACEKSLKSSEIQNYEDPDGWTVTNMEINQHLYFDCSNCGYDTSLEELGIPRNSCAA